MAKYQFEAKAVGGKLTRGSLEAKSEQEARVKLRAQKLVPIKIGVMKGNTAKAEAASLGGGLFGLSGVKEKDLQIFTRQFATLINAGVSVVEGLEILSNGLRPGILKKASARVKQSIEGGKALGDSLSEFPQIFDRLYINMVKAGEEAGVLDTILSRLAQYMEKAAKLKGQVKGAMMYPAIIISFSVAIVTGLMIFIVPKFTGMYTNAGQEPPALTQFVVSISHYLAAKWYVVIGVLVGIPILLNFYFQTPGGRRIRDSILLKIPVMGDLVQKSAIAKLSRTLSTLLSSGVGVVEAIEISARTTGNLIIEDALINAKQSITQGKTVAAPLARAKVIPDMVVQMISIGESSGTLDAMLGKVADFYEEEVEVAVGALTTIIEPLLMIVLGSIIAVIVIAMYLPIFNMANTIGV